MPKRILFFGQIAGSRQGLFEILLGKTLQMRGAEVLHVVCGPNDFRSCEIFEFHHPPGFREEQCRWACPSYHIRARKQWDLPVQTLGEWIPPRSRDLATAWAAQSMNSDLEKAQFDGVAIYPLVKSAIAMHLQAWATLDPNGRDRGYSIELMRNGIELLGAAERVVESFQPDGIVVWNGRLAASAAMFHVATKRSIPIYSFEGGIFLGGIVGQKTTPVTPEDLSEPWKTWRDHALDEQESGNLDRANKFCTSRKGVFRGSEQEQQSHSRAGLFERLGIPKTEKLAVLFTSVAWDTALAVADLGFRDQKDWIADAMATVGQRRDWSLVVRIHPCEALAEADIREPLRKRLAGLAVPPNVRIVYAQEKLDSYSLMEHADLGLNYVSTTGLELSVRGKPVIQAGGSHYWDKGFTFDAPTRESFLAKLGKQLDNPSVPGDWKELARRYAHLYFCKHPAALTDLMKLSDGEWTYPYSSFDALAPGASAELDRVAHFVLGERPWIFPYGVDSAEDRAIAAAGKVMTLEI